MAQSALYDEDILLWSEQQAEVIRALGRSRRDLPNELDIENVAEEIETVGRSELAVVQSQAQNILVHLIKIAMEPDSPAVRHWLAEIFAFQAELLRHYSPSMRQRIDLERQWRTARKLAILQSAADAFWEENLPTKPPFSADDLLAEELRPDLLVEQFSAVPNHR